MSNQIRYLIRYPDASGAVKTATADSGADLDRVLSSMFREALAEPYGEIEIVPLPVSDLSAGET